MFVKGMLIAGAFTLGGIGLVTTPAAADAGNGFPVELTCGTTHYELNVVGGHGEFTAAQDANSNAVFHPVAFGDFHGTVFDADGNLVEEFTEEQDSRKGQSGKNKADVQECTFSFTEVSDGSDPEFPAGYTFVGEGEVAGYWSPRN